MAAFRRLRARIRECFFQCLKAALTHEQGKQVLVDSLSGLISPVHGLHEFANVESPYDDTGRCSEPRGAAGSSDVVFLTGRFRSGSTLLWNIFRQLEGCTSFYEPFNERQWFDPVSRGGFVDNSHLGVSEYWREYDGADELIQYYDEDWIRCQLVMGTQCQLPGMKTFIERLIQLSPGRPILQFNRIDFRLPWIRRHFPDSTIVHLFRHPRDQWCSTLAGGTGFDPEAGTLEQFADADEFYLRMWVKDLRHHFPFLADSKLHPYRHFYWIWKLSYLYGVRYAHYSLRFEDLVAHPRTTLQSLFGRLNLRVNHWMPIESLVRAPHIGRWRAYADDEWFRMQETECERVLFDFLCNSHFLEAGREDTPVE